MSKLETDYKKVNWVGLKNEFLDRMRLLQIEWQASQKQCSPQVHAKMVKDLYLPALTKLAEFCACVEIVEEEGVEEADG